MKDFFKYYYITLGITFGQAFASTYRDKLTDVQYKAIIDGLEVLEELLMRVKTEKPKETIK